MSCYPTQFSHSLGLMRLATLCAGALLNALVILLFTPAMTANAWRTGLSHLYVVGSPIVSVAI